ncbi:MAG TPA: Imm21 family immunity protein [Gemmataceae bacterium]|nr:Imm21 family immunity protein [Gemmataceae bacterium]
MEKFNWIRGDGGPLVCLQKSAALQWRGASDFDNCLMNGGSVETDYDVICRRKDSVTVMKRYDRDFLVLDDSEWDACFVPSPKADAVIVQVYGSDCEPDEIVERLTACHPTRTFPFVIHDTAIRLLVGADNGDGSVWGLAELAVTAGEKACHVYQSEEAQVILLRPVTENAPTSL